MTAEPLTYFTSTMDSPCGPLGLAVDAAGAVVAIEFDRERSREPFRRRLAAVAGRLVEDAGRTARLERQLAEYFAGERRSFDLALAPLGSPFQLAVWEELKKIPFGETRSYGQIAAALGDPAACRAVGAANGANPISIVVPCHRVIGADGSLTGYGGGLANKRFLLEHEGALAVRGATEPPQMTLVFDAR